MEKSFTDFAKNEIKTIHALSERYNKLKGKDHAKALLELVKKHIGELEETFDAGDPHFVTEAGDLAVLCFELMTEYKRPVDDVMAECYGRYRRKLADLMEKEKDRC
jgi:hypothetical protein